MKKHPQKQHYSLGDLIMAVSSFSKHSTETVAAVADLLESGRVRFQPNPHRRIKVY